MSILPYSYFTEFFDDSNLQPFANSKLKNFDSSEIQIIGILPAVPCTFNGRSASIDFLLHDSDSAIIGVDAIYKLQLTISAKQTELQTSSVDQTTKPTTACKVNEPLPKLSGYQFFIKLKSDAPSTLVQRQRRIPFSLQSAVESEIQKLLINDIIEEIDHSPYISPIVVVPKPDGEIRLCVDYRRVNQHIVVDQHPLPTAEEIFTKLSGAKYFSKLDLRAAYHQLEIREDSRDLTSFISHVGLFRYKRLPFGLANAPSAYMKVIFNILRNCKNTVSYLDDILVFGAFTITSTVVVRGVIPS
ncbi:MAG: reverse transcriptase family protein [Pseudomonadota bacterium]